MKFLKITLAFLALTLFGKLYGQKVEKDWGRPNWSLSYKIGFADGGTEDFFSKAQTFGFKKNFNITKPVSLNLSTGYSHLTGKTGSNINALSLGGGLSLYPIYLTSLIFDNDYDPKSDFLYLDFGFEALLNKADFDYLYTIEANFYTFRFGKNQSLSPKLSYNIFLSDQQTNSNPIYKDLDQNALGFYSIGVTYSF